MKTKNYWPITQSIVIFCSIQKSSFWHVFDVFFDLVIFSLFSFKLYRFLCGKVFILCNFHVKKDIARLLMILLDCAWYMYKAFGPLVCFRTEITNAAVMLSDSQRNLTFNRSPHCTQVSDQWPLESLVHLFILPLGQPRKVGKIEWMDGQTDRLPERKPIVPHFHP